MTLISRLSQLMAADIHGLLDSIEEPKTMLRHAVREMEYEIAKNAEQIRSLNKRREYLLDTRARLERKYEELQHHIELSFQGQDAELTKSFIRKRLQHDRRVEKLTEELSDIAREQTHREELIKEQREKLSGVVEKMKIFSEEIESPSSNLATRLSSEDMISDEEVQLAFIEELRKREPAQTPIKE